MWYAIFGEDVADSLALRKKLRPDHLARIQGLHDQGRVLLAGPHPKHDDGKPADAGFTGSLMVIDFDSMEQAQEWADNDPYTLGGVFSTVTVKPFIQVLP